jgi:predicted nuclease of predicted toxin-antitoxin system
MNIKLDENLPARLVPLLVNLGHQVDTVADEGLTGKPDTDVWQRVKTEGRFLITQDLDFSDTRQFQPGTHPGILLVRLREPGANALLEHIGRALLENPLEAWTGCFIVLTEHKLRIKRPEIE